MIRRNILYPNTPGSRFDLDYYFGTHMPMPGKGWRCAEGNQP
jgi:hypothetical protein